MRVENEDGKTIEKVLAMHKWRRWLVTGAVLFALGGLGEIANSLIHQEAAKNLWLGLLMAAFGFLWFEIVLRNERFFRLLERRSDKNGKEFAK